MLKSTSDCHLLLSLGKWTLVRWSCCTLLRHDSSSEVKLKISTETGRQSCNICYFHFLTDCVTSVRIRSSAQDASINQRTVV